MNSKTLLVVLGLFVLFGLAGCSGSDECDDGPCCDDGSWVKEGEACVSGQDNFGCTADTCTANHECVQEVKAGYCLIDFECHPDGKPNPENECLVCDSGEETPAELRTMWSPAAAETPCDDGSFCTVDETCVQGVCTAGEPRTCPVAEEECQSGRCDEVNDRCVADPINEGGACDDGLACTENTQCAGGFCAGGNVPNCAVELANQGQTWDPVCQAAACSEAQGGCFIQAVNVGAACNDGNLCTNGDVCDASGTCAGQALDCQAVIAPTLAANQVQCTQGVCDPEVGCVASPKEDGTACDDGLFCTVDEQCMNGVCGNGTGRTCEDMITEETAKCLHVNCDEAADMCDVDVYAGWCYIDGVCYEEGETHATNSCQWCNPANFNDPNYQASVYAWSAKPDGEWCESDGNVCTMNQCNDGQCEAKSRVAFQACSDVDGDGMPDLDAGGNCADGNPANTWYAKDQNDNFVDAIQWATDENGGPGNGDFFAPCPSDSPAEDDAEGNAHCSYNICVDDQCIHPYKPNGSDCLDDGEECTSDVCWEGECIHDPETFNGNNCQDDGIFCTDDICDDGTCTHEPKANNTACFDDGNECTNDVCWDGACAHNNVANGTACLTDGEICTNDICVDGQCTAENYQDGQSCDAASALAALPAGEDPGIPAVPACQKAVCSGGTCDNTVPRSDGPNADVLALDDDPDDCMVPTCQAGAVVYQPVQAGTVCDDDGNPCTKNVCNAEGVCTHPSVDDGTACDVTGANDDETVCTLEQCVSGQCTYIEAAQGTDCNADLGVSLPDDGNHCTTAVCDGNGACGFVADPQMQGQACNFVAGDGTCGGGCGVDEACVNTVCVPKWLDPDENVCTEHVCAGTTCTAQNLPAGEPCEGAVGTQLQDDNNACTIAVCGEFDGSFQCGFSAGNEGLACNVEQFDGTMCTDDVCRSGVCTPEPVADGTACDVELSDDVATTGTAFCQAVYDGTYDCYNTQCWETQNEAEFCGGACGAGEVCINGGCVEPTDDCGNIADDDTTCTAPVCQTGVCTHAPDADEVGNDCGGNEFDDTLCTMHKCSAEGTCVASNVTDGENCGKVFCDDNAAAGNQQCTTDTPNTKCWMGDCMTQAQVLATDDGSCLDAAGNDTCAGLTEVCRNGVCLDYATDLDLAFDTQEWDENPCTDDICSAGVCAHNALEDGHPVTDAAYATDDECMKTVCQSGAPADITKPDGTVCNDYPENENLCVTVDNGRCTAGVCLGSETVETCEWESFENKCAAFECDPSTGGCEETESYDADNPTAWCDPTDATKWHNGVLPPMNGDEISACVTLDCVQNWGCTFTEVVCDDCNVCTTDSCNDSTGLCDYDNNWAEVAADGSTCADTCAENMVCVASECVPASTGGRCDDEDPCTFDYCDEAALNEDLAINPTAGCTHDAGHFSVDPEDNDICTQDTCDKNGLNNIALIGHLGNSNPFTAAPVNDAWDFLCECLPADEATNCDDGFACTTDTCALMDDENDGADEVAGVDPYLCTDLKAREVTADADDTEDGTLWVNAVEIASADALTGVEKTALTVGHSGQADSDDMTPDYSLQDLYALTDICSGATVDITLTFTDMNGNIDLELYEINNGTTVADDDNFVNPEASVASWTDNETLHYTLGGWAENDGSYLGLRIFMPTETDCDPACTGGNVCHKGECVTPLGVGPATCNGGGACPGDEYCYDDPKDDDPDPRCWAADNYENICNTYTLTVEYDDTACSVEDSCEDGTTDSNGAIDPRIDDRDTACNDEHDFVCESGLGCGLGEMNDDGNCGDGCEIVFDDCFCGEGYGCDGGACKEDVRGIYGDACAANNICLDVDGADDNECVAINVGDEASCGTAGTDCTVAGNCGGVADACICVDADDSGDNTGADECINPGTFPAVGAQWGVPGAVDGTGDAAEEDCYLEAEEFAEVAGSADGNNTIGDSNAPTNTQVDRDCGCIGEGLVCLDEDGADNDDGVCRVNKDWNDYVHPALATDLAVELFADDPAETGLQVYHTGGFASAGAATVEDDMWSRDVDWFKVDLCEDDTYTVTLTQTPVTSATDDVDVKVYQAVDCAANCGGPDEYCLGPAADDCGTVTTEGDLSCYPACVGGEVCDDGVCKSQTHAWYERATLTGATLTDTINTDGTDGAGGVYYLKAYQAAAGNYRHTTYSLNVTSTVDDADEDNDSIATATDLPMTDYLNTLKSYGPNRGAAGDLATNAFMAVDHTGGNDDFDYYAFSVEPNGQLEVFIPVDNNNDADTDTIQIDFVDDSGVQIGDAEITQTNLAAAPYRYWANVSWRVSGEWNADQKAYLRVWRAGVTCGATPYYFEAYFDDTTSVEGTDADNCEDGVDNDGDGATDCADQDCASVAGTNCPVESSTTGDSHDAQCTDTTDNDNDGFIDCMDDDCEDEHAGNNLAFGSGPAPGAAVEYDPTDAWNDPNDAAYDPDLFQDLRVMNPAGAGNDYEEDWFKFDACIEREVTIDLTFTGADVDAYVEDYDGNIVAAGLSGTDNEQIVFTPDFSGTYYLRVWMADDDACNNYDLSIEFGGDDDLEDNDSKPNATQLTFVELPNGEKEATFTGRKALLGDPDWYTFNAPEDTKVRVVANFVHNNGDLLVTLTDCNDTGADEFPVEDGNCASSLCEASADGVNREVIEWQTDDTGGDWDGQLFVKVEHKAVGAPVCGADEICADDGGFACFATGAFDPDGAQCNAGAGCTGGQICIDSGGGGWTCLDPGNMGVDCQSPCDANEYELRVIIDDTPVAAE